MEYIEREHWMKRNKNGGEVTITKEEYEKVVFPRLQEYLDNPTKRGNRSLLEEAVEWNATAIDLFLTSGEELEKLKKKIMADYRDKCIDEIEYETGYRYWSTVTPVEE